MRTLPPVLDEPRSRTYCEDATSFEILAWINLSQFPWSDPHVPLVL